MVMTVFNNVGFAHIPINPIGWKAPTAFAKRAGGRVFAGMSPAPEVLAYQNALREWLDENWTEPPIDYPVGIEWAFMRQQPTYVSESGRNVTKHKQDLTNMIKSTEDALQPRVLVNDVWVHEMQARVIDQGKHVTEPYVEFTIRRLR